MQFSLLENILTVLFLIAIVLWICYLCLRRRFAALRLVAAAPIAASAVTAAVNIPVVAIGGIDAANLLQLQGRGLAGVAVVSAIFAQADPCAASRELYRLAGQL